MNLHSIVSSAIGAVNRQIFVGIRVSVGNVVAADGSAGPQYATPCSFQGSISGNTLTVTSVAEGVVQVGQTFADGTGAVLPNTMIVGLGTGAGGTGTYLVSQEQNVPSLPMAAAVTLLAQVQPITWRDLQQLDGLNVQGIRKVMYINGAVDGVVRVNLKGGDLVTFPDGSVYLVAQILEAFNLTAGWTKAALTIQDGS
jgi:hypothetical protein